MAGFFAFPRRILPDLALLNPLGFKIGLELLVKSAPKNVKEIPIQFRERLYGESKLSLKEQLLYLLHLQRLFRYRFPRLSEFILFSLIGASGMMVDLFFVFLSYDVLTLPFRLARVVGFVFALTSNFFLNRKYTFPHASGGNPVRQYISFFAVCLVGFAANWFISVYLYEHMAFFHRYYLVAAFIGILGGMVINFLGSKFIAFR
jgi:dolichol-phosphate mannosyltransferase